jgi:transposase
VASLADAVTQQSDALMTRRRRLLGMLTAERNRLEHAVGHVRRSPVDHIRWLERRIAAVDCDLEDTIARSPVWRATEDLLRSLPGLGAVADAVQIHVANDSPDVAGEKAASMPPIFGFTRGGGAPRLPRARGRAAREPSAPAREARRASNRLRPLASPAPV